MSSGVSAPVLAPSAESHTHGGEDAGLADLVDLVDLVGTTGATALLDVSAAGRCGTLHLRPARTRPAPDVRCLTLAAEAGADVLVTPCFLCFGDLNHYQRTLDRADPARDIPVLHLSQMLGVACAVAPLRLDLTHTTASARRVLAPFVV